MIPSIPHDYVPQSREGELFNALKNLSDDYYVFHSLSIVKLIDDEWKEKEIDFVIFNRRKGILCLEAKAGNVTCVDGIWFYSSGIEMKDPFRQANDSKWQLDTYIKDFYGNNSIRNHCKFLSAVWFPGLDKDKLDRLALPSNANKELVLTQEDLDNPTATIERIFDIKISYSDYYGNRHYVETDLTKEQANALLRDILCPTFKILPSKTLELDYKRERFNALIAEQCNLLNYLEEQRSAVINGAAGTGKTMIAIEKARRHSDNGEKVLFLCFNSKLKDFLSTNYDYTNVEYYTIDGFACNMCSSSVADFNDLETKLIEIYDNMSFPYTHIIIDEGQDFGQKRMNSDEIFKLLEEIVLSTDKGTFYVFYDKMQLVQSFGVPKFIENADCRLTLYKNCRNTRRIAETSFKPFGKEPKLFDSALTGTLPSIVFVEDDYKVVLDNIIKETLNSGIEDIQILSCAAMGYSVLEPMLVEGNYYIYRDKKIRFTTCRKFKGLEADKVILVDVDKNSILDNNRLFYVGTSRARFELSIIATLSEDDCLLLINSFNSVIKRNDPKLSLAKLLGCKLMTNLSY